MSRVSAQALVLEPSPHGLNASEPNGIRLHSQAESHVSNLERKIRGSAVKSALAYLENREPELKAKIWQPSSHSQSRA
jgi:hypothetical protein